MKLHMEYEQGSQAWIEAHCGIPTASEFDNLVTPKFEPRDGETPKTYLAKKLAEAWGGPLLGFSTFGTEQGKILEGEALPWLAFEFGWKLVRPGFCTTDDGRIGCSPDALIGEDGGVELKCPEAHTHVKYLLAGTVPKEYLAQVHGCMYVTGRPWWKFISYRRNFPPLILTVARDEGIIEALKDSLVNFLAKFDAGMAKLIEINEGKPPPKREPMVFADDIAAGRSEEPPRYDFTP